MYFDFPLTVVIHTPRVMDALHHSGPSTWIPISIFTWFLRPLYIENYNHYKGDAVARWKSDLTLLWPASLSHQVRPFLGYLSSSVYSSRNYRDTNSSTGAESDVLYILYRAQALWWPMHGALQLSSSVSTFIFSTNMIDRLKYCSLHLLKCFFCDGKQTTSKQIKAQAPKAFSCLAKSLGIPARPINASTGPATGRLGPGTATLGFQTQGCEHVGLGPCLTSCLKHLK